MKRVGILFHPQLPAARALTQELIPVVGSLQGQAWSISAWEEEKARAMVPGTEVVFSVGGDGTILRAARIVVPHGVAIVGVNLGRVGFMTELAPAEALEKLPAILAGEGWLDERAMLHAEVTASGKVTHCHALNDVVLGRAGLSRLVHIRASIDGEFLTTYRADGVIVATATGSTGYSLAAGGPILYPQAREIILQPLLPHLNPLGPLVLASTSRVELEVGIDSDHQALLSLDGQVELPLGDGDRVRVALSPYVTRFLRLNPPGFFYRSLLARLSPRQ